MVAGTEIPGRSEIRHVNLIPLLFGPSWELKENGLKVAVQPLPHHLGVLLAAVSTTQHPKKCERDGGCCAARWDVASSLC